jgi:hypothetical protein
LSPPTRQTLDLTEGLRREGATPRALACCAVLAAHSPARALLPFYGFLHSLTILASLMEVALPRLAAGGGGATQHVVGERTHPAARVLQGRCMPIAAAAAPLLRPRAGGLPGARGRSR